MATSHTCLRYLRRVEWRVYIRQFLKPKKSLCFPFSISKSQFNRPSNCPNFWFSSHQIIRNLFEILNFSFRNPEKLEFSEVV
ncbi:hypothetical protein L6452_20376 [Arctium lappa]|uniref:Uncharacterized protein n=1 Tax=Arctium lappa TaxID=4217 RepID=A0ACB9BAP5_ARCLA|nr:hypothetical protein L6452_20376 [Arctium lappa]